MAIPRQVIDQIRERTDIVEVVGRYVALKRQGSAHVGLCPFHQEKTPSFNVLSHKGIYHCFGCGEGGDAFRFLMKIQGISFVEAVRELGAAAGVQVEERQLRPEEQKRMRTRASLHEVCEAATGFFRTQLLARPENEFARAYLAKRGITPEIVEKFRIGYAPDAWTALLDYLHAQRFPQDLVVRAGLARPSRRGDGAYDVFRNRIVFPILDSRERVVSFGGRLVPSDAGSKGGGDRPPPKYLNGPETLIYEKSKVLYGLAQARASIQREDRVLLVEGYFDVISLVQAGFGSVVATCGTSLTSDHLQVLRRHTQNVVALFDSDEAGVRAAVRSMPLFAEADVEALRLDVPGAKDPDEYVQEHGAEAFREILGRAEPLMETVIRFEAERCGSTPVGRQRALEALGPLLGRFSPVARSALIRRVADVLYLPETQVAAACSPPRGLGRPPPGPPPEEAPPLPEDDTPPPPGSPPPARLSREVRHLFWLLVHHPKRVGPWVVAVNPECICRDREVLKVMRALAEGRDLAEVLDRTEHPEIRATLGGAAARPDFYPEDRVLNATRQILARLEVRFVQQKLAALHRELSTCDATQDGTRYHELVKSRVVLQERLEKLKPVASGQSKALSMPSPPSSPGSRNAQG